MCLKGNTLKINQPLTTFFFIFLLGLMGCQTMKETPLRQRIRIEMEPFQSLPKEIVKAKIRVPIIFSAPQFISKKVTIPISDDRKEKQETITIKLVEKIFDSKNVTFTMLLRNISKKSIRKRIYIFGYNINGQLAFQRNNLTFFQSKEQIIKDYRFSRSSKITKWVFTVR